MICMYFIYIRGIDTSCTLCRLANLGALQLPNQANIRVMEYDPYNRYYTRTSYFPGGPLSGISQSEAAPLPTVQHLPIGSGPRAVHRADTAGRSKSGQYVCSCRVHRLVEVLTANTESARLGTSAEIIWRGYSRGRHQNRQLVRLPRPTRIVLGRRPQPTANGRPRASRVPAQRRQGLGHDCRTGLWRASVARTIRAGSHGGIHFTYREARDAAHPRQPPAAIYVGTTLGSGRQGHGCCVK